MKVEQRMTRHALAGAIFGLVLGVPPVSAALALFGIWWSAVIWVPLLAIPSGIFMARRRRVRALISFSASTVAAYVVGFTALMHSGPADWGAYLIGIVVVTGLAVLASPASLLVERHPEADQRPGLDA